MSIPVALDQLAATIAKRGDLAYLVTVGEHGPRVVSVTVVVDGDGDGSLMVGAGRHTAANVAVRPQVTLLWPAGGTDPKHSLLVDGTASVSDDGEHLLIVATGAILHRVRTGRGAPPTDDSAPASSA